MQFWIDRLVHTATQARKKIDAEAVPFRAKHFISASYMDLMHLGHYLKNVKTETYTETLMNKTSDKGDCCMMTMLEWGHSRKHIVDCFFNYDDEDHMNFKGEFKLTVNETCLSCDHEAFLVTERDRDAHNPLLIHFEPHMTNKETRDYRSGKSKIERKRRRKERQGENIQVCHQQEEQDDQDDDDYYYCDFDYNDDDDDDDDYDDDDDDDDQWTNFSQEDWWTWQTHERRRQQGRGQGYSASSASTTRRPKYR